MVNSQGDTVINKEWKETGLEKESVHWGCLKLKLDKQRSDTDFRRQLISFYNVGCWQESKC